MSSIPKKRYVFNTKKQNVINTDLLHRKYGPLWRNSISTDVELSY